MSALEAAGARGERGAPAGKPGMLALQSVQLVVETLEINRRNVFVFKSAWTNHIYIPGKVMDFRTVSGGRTSRSSGTQVGSLPTFTIFDRWRSFLHRKSSISQIIVPRGAQKGSKSPSGEPQFEDTGRSMTLQACPNRHTPVPSN